MGHAKGDEGLEMTMSRYAGDESLDAKAACVRAAKLPADVKLPTAVAPSGLGDAQ